MAATITKKTRSAAPKVESEKYIRLGKDNRYYVEIDRRRPDGTPFRKASKYTTLSKAITARDEWLQMLEASQSPQKLTLDDWAEQCFTEVMPFPHTRKKGLKPNTIGGYRLLYRLHASPLIGKLELRNLKPAQVMTIIHDRMSDHDSDSQANVRTVLSKLYSLAQAMDKVPIGFNPVKLVTVPRTGARHDEEGFEIQRVRNLTPADQENLLEASALYSWRFSPADEIFTGEEGRSWLYLSVLMGLRMGLRRGEILGFNLRHVDWDRRLYDVRWQVNRITRPANGETVQASDSLKKDGSYRTVPIPPSVFSEIVKTKEAKPESVFIFDTPDRKHRSPDVLNTMFKTAAREAGLMNCLDSRGGPLKDPTPHDLRHTFGYTHANILKTPHTALQKLLGHKNIQTTLSYYAVADVDDVIAAMANVP